MPTPKSQQSLVRSPHPPTQWNLRGQYQAVLNILHTKHNKNPPVKVLVLWFGFSFAYADFYLPRWLLMEGLKRTSLKWYSVQFSECFYITSGSEKCWPVGKIWPLPADLHATGQAHGAQDQDKVQHPQPHLQRDIQLHGRIQRIRK